MHWHTQRVQWITALECNSCFGILMDISAGWSFFGFALSRSQLQGAYECGKHCWTQAKAVWLVVMYIMCHRAWLKTLFLSCTIKWSPKTYLEISASSYLTRNVKKLNIWIYMYSILYNKYINIYKWIEILYAILILNLKSKPIIF